MSDPRPCERRCIECNEWKHHSRFRLKTAGHSTVSRFSPRCQDCEQKLRNEKKNLDRPKAIIESRARALATRTGVSFDFIWMQMGYRTLVEPFRGLMSDKGLCQQCGHRFVNERDIQIEHTEAPRFRQDWARFHAGNIRFSCGSCNRKKGSKPFGQWLDEQESARLSNLEQPSGGEQSPKQNSLFDWEDQAA